MPRSRSPSPSTTSKSKHQHNISGHCRQQFSFFFSQSILKATLNDRRESNACTFIAFYLAKSYHAKKGHLPAPTQISTMWVAAVMSCIIQGNATNDTLTGGGAIYFAVHEAVCQLRQSLGQIQIENSFDITLTSENTDVPQSSAALYLQSLTQDSYYRYHNLFCCTWCKHCDVRQPLAW